MIWLLQFCCRWKALLFVTIGDDFRCVMLLFCFEEFIVVLVVDVGLVLQLVLCLLDLKL